MFSIELKDSTFIVESVFHAKFSLTIDDYQEYFLAPLSYWSVDQYQKHWKKKLSSFCTKEIDTACLVTEMYDPDYANFIRFLIFYREADLVYIQEQMLFFEDFKNEFSVDELESMVSDRETVNEDGDEISEWVMEFKQLQVSVDGVNKP